jgi:hypothetical protein
MIFSRSKAVLVTTIIALFFQGTMGQINILSSQINFRTSATAVNSTTHYGDLHLEGGVGGGEWGWLYCNRVICAGDIQTDGNSMIYGNGTYGGSLVVYGAFNVFGSKNFVQPHPTDTTKVIKYVSAEAGEALTLARGTTITKKGEAVILLPEHYTLVTSTDKPVSTTLTPKNVPALLYVVSENNQKIVVRVKNSDYIEFGDVEFNYYVTGVRDGFEDIEPIQDVDESKNSAKPVSEKKKAYDEKVKRIMDKNMDKAKEKNN